MSGLVTFTVHFQPVDVDDVSPYRGNKFQTMDHEQRW